MNSSQWFAIHEALQGFDTQSKLPYGKRSLSILAMTYVDAY